MSMKKLKNILYAHLGLSSRPVTAANTHTDRAAAQVMYNGVIVYIENKNESGAYVWSAGIIVGGASLMYLLTIPDVVKLSALQISQVYTLVAFGILFFAANVGAAVAIFTRDILLREFTK